MEADTSKEDDTSAGVDDSPRRKRGRPPGAKNKPKPEISAPMPRLVPPSSTPFDDYRHADPGAIISRQISLLDWAQQALRNEMMGARAAERMVDNRHVERLEKLSNGILRAIDALKKYDGLAEELMKRMSPEQLLDAAVRKIEGQDLATLNAVIRRLRLYRSKLAPISTTEKVQLGEAAISPTGKSVAEELAAMEIDEVR